MVESLLFFTDRVGFFAMKSEKRACSRSFHLTVSLELTFGTLVTCHFNNSSAPIVTFGVIPECRLYPSFALSVPEFCARNVLCHWTLPNRANAPEMPGE